MQWPPQQHRRILFESPLRQTDEKADVQQVLARFLARAFRRPATAEETAPAGGKPVEEVRGGLKREASILGLLMENTRSLRGRLGTEDAAKMDEYLDSTGPITQLTA